MTTGLIHGPLAGQDLTKLTGLSVLLMERNGQMYSPVGWDALEGLVCFAGWKMYPDRFEYLGEWSDDTRKAILAPEGGWKSNPVPGRRVRISTAATEDYLPWASEDVPWDRVVAFSLIEDAKADPSAHPCYGEHQAGCDCVFPEQTVEPVPSYLARLAKAETSDEAWNDERRSGYTSKAEGDRLERVMRAGPPGSVKAAKAFHAKAEGEGAAVQLTKASEVMDLMRSRTDPFVKALNRAQMDDADRIDLAYAIIADRKDRASSQVLAVAGEPVAWRYRFVTTTDGLEWSDWNYVDDYSEIVSHKGQSVEPLYATPTADQSGWNTDMTRLPAAVTLLFRDPVDGDGMQNVRLGLSTDAMNADAWSHLPDVATADQSGKWWPALREIEQALKEGVTAREILALFPGSPPADQSLAGGSRWKVVAEAIEGAHNLDEAVDRVLAADQSGVIGALVEALENIKALGDDGEHSGDRHARCRNIARQALAAHAASIEGKS